VHNEQNRQESAHLSTELTDQALALRLREVLKITKTSQRHVCESLDMPYRTLQSYLSGSTRIPAVFLIALSEFLKLELDFIVNDRFRPRNRECADAMLHALREAALIPIETNPPTSEEVIRRWKIVTAVSSVFRETYERYCRDVLWLSKSGGKDM
jgi:transcriptional regulator with XRE-family HTH domain